MLPNTSTTWTACSPPFSSKIRLVLISSSAIANHDVIITIITIIFSSRAYALVSRESRLAALPPACLSFACSNFAKKNKRLLGVYLQL